MMQILLKTVLVGCVIICVFSTHGVCFSRGASFSSCVNMKPGHISSLPQHTLTHSAVTIRSRSVYLPQHTLTVTVQSSRAFMGFLLQARSVLEDRVVEGEFTLHPPSTHTLSCFSTDDTVTHSDKMLKRNLSFSWRAPPQPSGDLRFYITLVQSYFVYWARIRSAVVYDGTRSSQNTNSDMGQSKQDETASIPEQTVQHTPLFAYTTMPTHTNTHSKYNIHTPPIFNAHTNTQSANDTQTSISPYIHTTTQTFPQVSLLQNIYSSPNPNLHLNRNTNTLKPISTNQITANTHTDLNMLLEAQTDPSIHTLKQQTQAYTPSHNHNSQPTLNTYTNTHKITANNTHTDLNMLLEAQTDPSLHTLIQQTQAYTPSHNHNTQPTLNTYTNTHKITANNTHTDLNMLLEAQTDPSIHTLIQQTYTYTPLPTQTQTNALHTYNPNTHKQTVQSSYTSSDSTTILSTQTHIFTPDNPSLHHKPSPAPRRSLSDLLPSRESTEGAVSLTKNERDSSDLSGDVRLKPPKRPKDPSGAPKKGGERPEHVPRQNASELGLLLGLSGVLGMAIALGLRYLQRKHCRKRTAMSFNDHSHDNRGIIHVQECGDLVQVRKIRQNSFLVLQAEYDLITPTGN
ncbi:reelin domain-containing protein 1-like [Xyrauchen texanus]|uniref:reelin domain-containing protein 1-like n=1 Tax=Xyrauchen texanus TaxID=154827 RepID=UPI002241B9E1|nr:reelin domain-containing protein 1-like [Xyrauchen texanus]